MEPTVIPDECLPYYTDRYPITFPPIPNKRRDRRIIKQAEREWELLDRMWALPAWEPKPATRSRRRIRRKPSIQGELF